jgi:hypothetical protein
MHSALNVTFPQKSSLHLVTVRNKNELIGPTISSQHDQEWTLMDGL